MPLFKRTLSECLFRRFVRRHYAANLFVEASGKALERIGTPFFVRGQQVAVRIPDNRESSV